MVPGGVLLLAGEPGVGKSTLLLEVAARYAAAGPGRLYVTGEESAGQVRLRAERIGALATSSTWLRRPSFPRSLGHVDEVQPSPAHRGLRADPELAEVEGTPGRRDPGPRGGCALIRLAKERGHATVLVGHVTKDGSIAGPRVLEHLVDVVLQFEGDRHSQLRMLRAVKNRYGATDEIGCFDLTDAGIVGLPDPSGLFLTRRTEPVPGTCVTVTMEGSRPLLAEVQALVARTASAAAPRHERPGLPRGWPWSWRCWRSGRPGAMSARRRLHRPRSAGCVSPSRRSDLALALALAGSHTDMALPRHGRYRRGGAGR